MGWVERKSEAPPRNDHEEGHPGPSALRGLLRDWAGILLLSQGALVVFYGLWVVFRWGGPERRNLVSDLAFLPAAAIPAILAWRAARPPAPCAPPGRAWRLIALAYGANGLGEALWLYYEVVRRTVPFPSWADAAYLSFYPFMLWGLLSFPASARSRGDTLRFWIDTLTVSLGGGMLLWHFLLDPTAAAGGNDPLAAALALAYPVGDLAVLFGAATVLLGRPRAANGLRLLAVGLLFWIAADVLYGYRSLQGTFESGSWIDMGWLLALLLAAAGAWSQDRHRPPIVPALPEHPRKDAFAFLPHAATVLGYALLLSVARTEWGSPLSRLIPGAAALAGLAVARHLLDARERKRAEEELLHLANHDPLTGLANRRRFLEELERRTASARRSHTRGALLLLDLDGFKEVNDTLGHLVGDEVLKGAAALLQRRLRETDFAARLGGDEFAILLEEVDASGALRVAEDLAAALRAHPIAVGARCLTVGASIGVALFPEHGLTPTELLARADSALYEAKRLGGGRISLCAPSR